MPDVASPDGGATPRIEGPFASGFLGLWQSFCPKRDYGHHARDTGSWTTAGRQSRAVLA